MHTQKNRLPCRNQSGYIPAAPHKTGAGITTPLTTQAHNRASGFFVRAASSHLFRTRIMVGRTGPTSVGPGSCVAGCGNPVRLTTLRLPPLDGEFSELTTQEATPWQTANNSAPALSAFTSAPKSTADFSAHHASRKSCTSICCMSALTPCQTVTVLLFSATWRMICASCRTSSSSKTNSINSGTRHLLYFATGGLRTPITRRLAMANVFVYSSFKGGFATPFKIIIVKIIIGIIIIFFFGRRRVYRNISKFHFSTCYISLYFWQGKNRVISAENLPITKNIGEPESFQKLTNRNVISKPRTDNSSVNKSIMKKSHWIGSCSPRISRTLLKPQTYFFIVIRSFALSCISMFHWFFLSFYMEINNLRNTTTNRQAPNENLYKRGGGVV
ncbi:TPA: ash family protein [Escherichia coli]|nr:ash family protein [Escherichia coli]